MWNCISILMHCILIFSILVPIPHGRHVAVRRQSATRLPRRLRPTPRPPRRPGQGCLWLGKSKCWSTCFSICESNLCWIICNVICIIYIYTLYIYISVEVSVEVCWSTWLWTLKCNWEDSWWTFPWEGASIVLSEFTAYPKTLRTTDGIHWALVATWCPHRACASPYKGHPTLSSYKARA